MSSPTTGAPFIYQNVTQRQLRPALAGVYGKYVQEYTAIDLSTMEMAGEVT